MNAYDVIVVGARVAGASTAMLLARAGARVALVERSAYGTDTVSTHGLMRAGVLQLSRWGLLDRLADTPPIRCATFHYSDREPEPVSLRSALYAPRRHLLDRVLTDAAAEAGADVSHGTAVTELLRDEHERVTGVRLQDRSELTAAITIGADGIRSTVASATRAPVVRRGRSRSAVLYRYCADVQVTGYEWAYARGCGAGLIPTNDGLACVFVATTPDRMRALRREGADRAFAVLLGEAPDLAERVFRAKPAGRMHGWAGAAGFVRRSWGPGWALVGDAGYYKDPITTHGITDALRDAELLTRAISTDSLANYEKTRDRLSRDLFDATETVASYTWTLDEARLLLRQVSAAMRAEVDQVQSLDFVQ